MCLLVLLYLGFDFTDVKVVSCKGNVFVNNVVFINMLCMLY